MVDSARWTRFSFRPDDVDGSLFTPGSPIWRLETSRDLHVRFVENPDESGDPFEVKFQRQLGEASDDTIKFAAELLYVHFLPVASVSGNRKRALVSQVLRGCRHRSSLPPSDGPCWIRVS